MSDPALSPAQLDRLEDALEDLEAGGIPDALLDPGDDEARPVADALEVYRSILVLARESLPSEDVPAGLLDDVLAEARRAAAAPAEPTAKSVPWWRRLGGWGPALAFAGTAALLVVLVRPTGDAPEAPAIARSEPAGAAEAKADARADAENEGQAKEAAAAAEEQASQADAIDRDEDMRLAEAQPKAEGEDVYRELGGEGSELRGGAIDSTRQTTATKLPAADPAPDDGSADKKTASSSPAEKKKRSKGGRPDHGGRTYDPEPAQPNAAPKPTPKKSAGSGGVPAGPTPSQPATPPASKDDDAKPKAEVASGWADIETGDAKRRAGACGSANVAYQRASEDDSAAIRARAFAGLGLCALEAGNAAAAEAWFKKARAADPGVGKLIESERARHEPQDKAQAVEQADEP